MSKEQEYEDRVRQRELDRDWARVEATKRQIDREWQEELDRERKQRTPA